MNARRSRPSGPGARGTAVARPAAAMLFAAALLLPAEALAHKCDRTDNDRREASRVIADLTGEIDAMERAIIEALRLQTGQLSGYIAQSAKAVTGALDSQTKLQAQIEREAAETGAMRARRPSRSGCEAITGLTGLAGTQAATENARARAGITETGRIVGERRRDAPPALLGRIRKEEPAGLRGVRSVARAPGVAGLDPVGVCGDVAHLLERVAAVATRRGTSPGGAVGGTCGFRFGGSGRRRSAFSGCRPDSTPVRRWREASGWPRMPAGGCTWRRSRREACRWRSRACCCGGRAAAGLPARRSPCWGQGRWRERWRLRDSGRSPWRRLRRRRACRRG